LIENYIDSLPLYSILQHGPTVFDKQIASLGLSSFLKMLLLDNKIHADLHPGNILVSFHNAKSSAFVDSKVLDTLKSLGKDELRNELCLLKEAGYLPYIYFIYVGLSFVFHSKLAPFSLMNCTTFKCPLTAAT
jgi:ABC1 atypical kinase-like domain